jgi:large subunit ribosomal protein L4
MSYTITLLDSSWKVKSTKDLWVLDDSIVNEWLIHEYVVMYLANQRQSSAHTKGRWEVKRSWRKLYRQKGTWNARVWDAWSPIRRSGWVAMGPRSDRNWSKAMPKKMKRKALLWAIALQAKNSNVYGIEDLTYDVPSTKSAWSLVTHFHMAWKSLLVVTWDNKKWVYKSFRNLNRTSVLPFGSINAYEMMKYHTVLFTNDAIESLVALVS